MKTVLFIDDNPFIGSLLKREMEIRQYRVMVTSGTDTTGFHRKLHSADLVMISYHLNGDGGWHTFSGLKQRFPERAMLVYAVESNMRTSIKWIERTIRDVFNGNTMAKADEQMTL